MSNIFPFFLQILFRLHKQTHAQNISTVVLIILINCLLASASISCGNWWPALQDASVFNGRKCVWAVDGIPWQPHVCGSVHGIGGNTHHNSAAQDGPQATHTRVCWLHGCAERLGSVGTLHSGEWQCGCALWCHIHMCFSRLSYLF